MKQQKSAKNEEEAQEDPIFSEGVHAGGGGHSGSDRWLLTYSDLVTLLLIFFIIMYSIARENTSKTNSSPMMQAFAAEFRHVFHESMPMGLTQNQATSVVPTSKVPSVPAQLQSQAAAMSQNMATIAASLDARLRAAHMEYTTHVAAAPQSVTITFSSKVYFASASAFIQPAFAQALVVIAPVLRTVPYEIEVRGFTNNLPLMSRKYPTAWELAAARAVNVLRFLTETQHVPPHNMVALSYGQWNTPYTDQAHGLVLNRSVDLVITDRTPSGKNNGGPDTIPAVGATPWPGQYH